MIVGNERIEAGVQRILAAFLVIEAVEDDAFTYAIGRDHHRLELADLDHGLQHGGGIGDGRGAFLGDLLHQVRVLLAGHQVVQDVAKLAGVHLVVLQHVQGRARQLHVQRADRAPGAADGEEDIARLLEFGCAGKDFLYLGEDLVLVERSAGIERQRPQGIGRAALVLSVCQAREFEAGAAEIASDAIDARAAGEDALRRIARLIVA